MGLGARVTSCFQALIENIEPSGHGWRTESRVSASLVEGCAHKTGSSESFVPPSLSWHLWLDIRAGIAPALPVTLLVLQDPSWMA